MSENYYFIVRGCFYWYYWAHFIEYCWKNLQYCKMKHFQKIIENLKYWNYWNISKYIETLDHLFSTLNQCHHSIFALVGTYIGKLLVIYIIYRYLYMWHYIFGLSISMRKLNYLSCLNYTHWYSVHTHIYIYIYIYVYICIHMLRDALNKLKYISDYKSCARYAIPFKCNTLDAMRIILSNQFSLSFEWSQLVSRNCSFDVHSLAFSVSAFDQYLNFKIWRDHQKKKKSYERYVYETVDVRGLFWVIYHKSTECSSQKSKGYTCFIFALLIFISF